MKIILLIFLFISIVSCKEHPSVTEEFQISTTDNPSVVFQNQWKPDDSVVFVDPYEEDTYSIINNILYPIFKAQKDDYNLIIFDSLQQDHRQQSNRYLKLFDLDSTELIVRSDVQLLENQKLRPEIITLNSEEALAYHEDADKKTDTITAFQTKYGKRASYLLLPKFRFNEKGNIVFVNYDYVVPGFDSCLTQPNFYILEKKEDHWSIIIDGNNPEDLPKLQD